MNRSAKKASVATERYTDKITRGTRTYFFDINESSSGDLYLRLSESKKGRDGFDHHRLMVFEEDIDAFTIAFQRLISKLKVLRHNPDRPSWE